MTRRLMTEREKEREREIFLLLGPTRPYGSRHGKVRVGRAVRLN